MFLSIGKLINDITPGKPDSKAANALQEGLGGQFGEMRTMMQYMFQNFNFRGKAFSRDKSETSKIFKGNSPFGEGELEILEGSHDGFTMPYNPETPQEFAPGVDREMGL